MWYISREGYLKNIIETLVRGDNELLKLLAPSSGGPSAETSLYTYESKMAFFTRMASSPAGAELLLESGLMVRLSEMKVFSARPEAAYQIQNSEATPRSLQVYRQILFPALRLCLAVLSCLGTTNVSAVVHIKHFIKANEHVFRTILHPPTHESIGSISGLEEISLLTGVLAKTGCGGTEHDINAGEDFLMLKQQMLSLIHHFDASPPLLERSVGLVGTAHAPQVVALLVRISVNLHMFVRQVASPSSGKCRIIFSPKLASKDNGPENVVLTGRPLNLGQVVRSVGSLSGHYIRTQKGPKGQQPSAAAATDLGSAIESTLWVVWKHADFFSRCGEQSLDVMGGMDSASISREMRLLFTDEVFMQLLDVDKLMSPGAEGSGGGGSGGFINTLVRRLKRVVSPM